jgi:CO/xanthine dehydrogenase FAD-binding subunit
MRSVPSDYTLIAPKTLGDALALLAEGADVWHPIAGGTDVMVLYEAGQLTQTKLMSLWGLSELRGLRTTPAHLEIGALATYGELQQDQTVAREFPSLARAGAETGGPAIQNRGTIGGNLANASPAADTPPALLCYDAEVELVSARGARWVPLDGFHTSYKRTVMRQDELIRTIRLPRQRAWTKHWYRKVGTRKAQAISKVVAAGAVRLEGGRLAELRLAMGSVAATVVRLRAVEACLRGQAPTPALIAAAREAVARDVKPIDDIRSTAEYRLAVAQNLVEQFLAEL